MIYFIQKSDGQIKIGYTTDLKKRLERFRMFVGDVEVLATIEGDKALEHHLHKVFTDAHAHHEWFYPTKPLMRFIHGLPDKWLLPDEIRVVAPPVQRIHWSTILGIAGILLVFFSIAIVHAMLVFG